MKYVNTHVFIMHGEKDTIVPISDAYKLFSRLKRPYTPWWADNADHYNIHKIHMKEYFNQLFDFIAAINKFNQKYSSQ